MGIPIGKCTLYSAAAGIHPARTLPVSLDVGTDNQALLDDDLYLGWRRPRLRGAAYAEIVEEFVTAVRRRFPRALVQWEDFKKQNAFDLLDRYRRVVPSFNDDVQGTGACVLAGVLAAGRAAGRPVARERVLVLGAGAAGIGVARVLRDTFRRAGVSGADLSRAIAVVEVTGLLVQGAQPLDGFQTPFAWPADLAAAAGVRPGDGLEAIVRALRPTALVGVCGQGGAFTKPVLQALAEGAARPVVLPLSNPTNQCEAAPDDVLAWTDGRALVATGSPFPPVIHEGRARRVGQCNNAFVFPGIGLGALVAEAREVTDGMCLAAGECLAGLVSDADLAEGALYPPIGELRRAAGRIAEAVVRAARDEGVGRALPDAAIAEAVAGARWEPRYVTERL
jgi:malate dehydrogenase (oxaloacetate-decarboxylating)